MWLQPFLWGKRQQKKNPVSGILPGINWTGNIKKKRAEKIQVADMSGWQIMVEMVDDKIWQIRQKSHRNNYKFIFTITGTYELDIITPVKHVSVRAIYCHLTFERGIK